MKLEDYNFHSLYELNRNYKAKNLDNLFHLEYN